MTYQLGTEVEISASFTDDDGVPVDPAVVTLAIRSPDGESICYTSPEVMHPATGEYSFDLLVNQAGPWVYNWRGEGGADISSGDQYFTVERTAVDC